MPNTTTHHPLAGLQPLAPGARIAVVAPGYHLEPELLEQGVAALQRLGFEVRVDPRCRACHGRLAGDDGARAAALMDAFTDPAVDAILTLRGGYGCTRLLERLDYRLIAAHPKPLIGYSDVTALLLALQPLIGPNAIHGPCLESLGRGLNALDTCALLALLAADAEGYDAALAEASDRCRLLREGEAVGPLIGGNLTLLASLIGTPQDFAGFGRLLFLEDWKESQYRIDRMMTQLRASGRLHGIAGLVLGAFTHIGRIGEDLPEELEESIIRQLPGAVPVLAGLPAGHDGERLPLPLGVRFRLDRHGLRLAMD